MKQKGWIFGSWSVLMLAVLSMASNYKLVNGQKDFYYGHISYADIKNDGQDPVVFRENRVTPETAVLNLPLGPGDVIQTTAGRRTEIQFDNGTIVRLDLDSRLKIETVMAQSLSSVSKISNLILQKGQVYVMYRKYSSLEIFQLVTPGAAVKIDHNSVVLIRLAEDGSTDVQVERGKAYLLCGADKTHLSQKRINAKQRGIVSAENRVELAEYEGLSDFKAWNESINSHFPELHEGNTLPKPIRNVSTAVFEFAQKFGNMYGEWIWHDLYGYVWRPYLNDQRYPWGTWQPYINGSWTSYGQDMFWVPSEPWGWVPYHLGIWMWDTKKGWMWLPGSLFAPAWAVWDFYAGYYSWRPYSLYDWMYGFDNYWAFSSWGGHYGTAYPPGQRPPFSQPGSDVIYTIRKDQLKKNDSPALPMPKEMKKALEMTLAALKRGDPAAFASAEGLRQNSIIIKKQDFLSPKWQEKIVPLDRLAKEAAPAAASAKTEPSPRSAQVSRDARLVIDRSRAMADLREWAGASPKRPGEITMPSASSSSFRFRDWNPDARAAIRLGVEISYRSRTNEVACPQLGLSSRDIRPSSHWSGGSANFGSSRGSSGESGRSSAAGSSSSMGKNAPSGSSGSSRTKK
jgi:Family of unknown function (DUF6600)/FecR protein